MLIMFNNIMALLNYPRYNDNYIYYSCITTYTANRVIDI